jgi:tetratricopeptide (TPR) repeat protein
MGLRLRFAWVPLLCSALAWSAAPEWTEVKSPHFSVVTDAGEKRGRDVALRFEQMRAVFGSLMAVAKVNLPVPLQIVAFRNTKELRQFAPLWNGKPTQMAGLFQAGPDRGFIMLDMSVENPWEVVFHEYGHQLLHGNVQEPMDPWFDEGFAEYFSSIEVDGKQARVGKVTEDTYRSMEYTGIMKVSDLLRVQQNSSVYNESGDHRTSFYTTSSFMVHYLYDNQWISKLGKYFGLVKQDGKTPDDAFQQAFGVTPQQFDKQLRQYATSGQFRYHVLPAPAGLASDSFNSKSFPDLDLRVLMADIHLHSTDYQEKARTEFEEVLKADPGNAGALRGLGYACLRKQDFEHAREYFGKAVERDANDPWVLYYSAMFLKQEHGEGFGIRGESAAIMQKRLEKAVELNPEFADAYSLLGSAYMIEGKNEESLKALIKAINLNPQNEKYRLNAANVYMNMRQFDKASAVLHTLQKSSNPEVVARAGQVLSFIEESKRAEAEIKKANEQIAQGNSLLLSYKADADVQTTVAAPVGSINFVKGKIASVDCSGKPAAILRVMVGGKAWNLKVKDTSHVVVIGADQFSCSWINQRAAVNYRSTGESTGDIVSLEIQ